MPLAFVRRHADEQPQLRAVYVANPPDGRLLPGPPPHWPPMLDWEEGFDLTAVDTRYAEIHPSAPAKCMTARRITERPATE